MLSVSSLGHIMNATFTIPETEAIMMIRVIEQSGGCVKHFQKKWKNHYEVSFLNGKKKQEQPYFKGTIFAKLPKWRQDRLRRNMKVIDEMVVAGKLKHHKLTEEEFLRA